MAVRGPAPRSLTHYAVSVAADGTITDSLQQTRAAQTAGTSHCTSTSNQCVLSGKKASRAVQMFTSQSPAVTVVLLTVSK
jgi:hypothetical protein